MQMLFRYTYIRSWKVDCVVCTETATKTKATTTNSEWIINTEFNNGNISKSSSRNRHSQNHNTNIIISEVVFFLFQFLIRRCLSALLHSTRPPSTSCVNFSIRFYVFRLYVCVCCGFILLWFALFVRRFLCQALSRASLSCRFRE